MSARLVAAALLVAAITVPSAPAQTPNPCSIFTCPTRTVPPGQNNTTDDGGTFLGVPMPAWFADWMGVVVLVLGAGWLFVKWILHPALETLDRHSLLTHWKRTHPGKRTGRKKRKRPPR